MGKNFFLIFIFAFQAFAYSDEAEFYLEALSEAENSQARNSLEVLYSNALLAAEELGSEYDLKNPGVLKEISGKYRGLSFSEAGASVNHDFFLRLAESRGLNSDTEFFRLLMKENSSFPDLYRKMFSESDFCYTIGGGDFSVMYKRWKAYSSKYPSAYTEFADNSLETMESVVSGNVENMCYSREEVLKSLARFKKENMGAEINSEINDFIARIKSSKCEVKFGLLFSAGGNPPPPVPPAAVPLGPKKD